tara:strand:- start:5114 stop:5245 length:132 start_codon:yes stop_codon:yes gene_type:complete
VPSDAVISTPDSTAASTPDEYGFEIFVTLPDNGAFTCWPGVEL